MSRRCWYGAASALVVLLAGACDRSHNGKAPKLPPDAPNVLLITLDTTRADRLGCYGYSKALTPVLDALAGSGVRFENAFCQAPLTLPSHASLLTSTYPPSNGLRFNASGVLSDAVPTLAAAFKDRGYRTGAFVAAWVLNSTFGLNRGFDCYDDKFDIDPSAPGGEERPADAVCDAALAWLNQAPQQPFFAWVHFFDPHLPYQAPPAFREKLADPYDAEIAFMDSQIRRLLDWLDAGKCRDRTLVVAAGDHGEAFGEHGETSHGIFLYNTTVHVPLLFSFPSHLAAGRTVSAGVRLIDIAPTILDLMKWEPGPNMQGDSLLPALEGREFAFLPSYSETDYPRSGFGWAPLYCYTTQQWKYIDAPRPELYDRAADPEELKNLVTERPDVASGLLRDLNDLRSGMVKRDAQNVELDERGRRALSSLGYVGATTPNADDDGKARPDPKDMIPVYRRLTEAHTLCAEQRWAEAVQILESLLADKQESDALHCLLGDAYLQLRRFKEAEREYSASLRTLPDGSQRWCKLGDALVSQSKVAEAITCYQQSIAASPNNAMAHNRLGIVYVQQRQLDKAYEHLSKCVELYPKSPSDKTNLGNLLSQMGRRDEALKLLQETVRAHPQFAPAHEGLYQALLSAGRRAEAIEVLRSACKILPKDLSLKSSLATLLLRVPRPDPAAAQEALGLARQCCEADPNSPEYCDVLASALVASGDIDNAIAAATRALSLAQSQGKSELAAQIQARFQALRSARPGGRASP